MPLSSILRSTLQRSVSLNSAVKNIRIFKLIMNIPQKINQIKHEDKESDEKNKQMLYAEQKKYRLERDFREINFKLSGKQTEMKKLNQEVIKLDSQLIVLEKQYDIAKRTLEDLLKKVVEGEKKTEYIQVNEYYFLISNTDFINYTNN